MIDGKHIHLNLLCPESQPQLLLDSLEEVWSGLNTISAPPANSANATIDSVNFFIACAFT